MYEYWNHQTDEFYFYDKVNKCNSACTKSHSYTDITIYYYYHDKIANIVTGLLPQSLLNSSFYILHPQALYTAAPCFVTNAKGMQNIGFPKYISSAELF
jgi:hypothetical protein